MLRKGDVDKISVSGTRGRRIRFKAYPSTGVEGARSKRSDERPLFSPHELMVMQKTFNALKPEERPKIHYEHGRRGSLPQPLGEVTRMEYNDLDGWMYLEGEIYDQHVGDVRGVIDNGLRGASLCFGVNPDYKQLLEVSLVENPDFEGATVVSYHSADATDWQQKAYCTAVFDHQRMTDELRIHKLSDGSYVVPNERYLDAARDYVSQQGDDPSRIEVIDPGMLNNLPAEEREAMQAAMLAESKLASQRSQEQAAKNVEKEVQSAFALVQTLTTNTDVSDSTQQDLGRAILENPAASAVAKLAAERLREQEKKIQQLSEEKEKKDAQLSAISQRVRTGIRMHSAGATTFSDIWAKLSKAAQLDQHASSSTTSSSSSSSSTSIYSHSAGDDAAPRRASAKRVLDEVPLTDSERQLEEVRAKYRRGALDFCPGAMPQLTTSEGTRVFAHSFGVKTESAMARITNRSTNADVVNAIMHDVLHGKRDVGIKPSAFAHSLLATKPEVFMQIAEGLVDGEVPTNATAGIAGWGTPASESGAARQAPAICGLTGRRRAALQQSYEKFGEC